MLFISQATSTSIEISAFPRRERDGQIKEITEKHAGRQPTHINTHRRKDFLTTILQHVESTTTDPQS